MSARRFIKRTCIHFQTKNGISQDRPAAQESCSLFVILRRGGKIIITPHTAIQPPPNLPRRGGTDTIGYLIITHGNLIITHGNLIITHSNLIIGDLSLTRVTCIQQSLTKQSICPSPSGEARWGLMSLAKEVFDKAE